LLAKPFESELALVASAEWWPSAPDGLHPAVERLWGHSLAASLAARGLAEEASLDDVEHLGRVALLADLGLWALAALDPDTLDAYLAIPEPEVRAEFAREALGRDIPGLGRQLAEAWGVHPDLLDAAWLGPIGDASLNACARSPDRLRLIQQAYARAEQTPWRLGTSARPDPDDSSSQRRSLVASVQSCLGRLKAEEVATPHEERLTRQAATLSLRNARLEEERERGAASLRSLQASVTAKARAEPLTPARSCQDDDLAGAAALRSKCDAGLLGIVDQAAAVAGELAAERDRLAAQLDDLLEAHREAIRGMEAGRRRELLEALAEFAAGAGHELNNPLAVIVGRAQLLLARAEDPEMVRSLRAILTQAQRAHRILRDLIYVARPPAPRPRGCQPVEVVRACLRDLAPDAESRGVRLVFEAPIPSPKAWTDPDALRHLVEALARNALEASRPGGTVRVSGGAGQGQLTWTFRDEGAGISAEAARHLVNPFYCGRQAGRGLGLGLPRVVRYLRQVGGRLAWRADPGGGTTFVVRLPISDAPGGEPDGREATTGA
jgi:signal transduction histidine kinase